MDKVYTETGKAFDCDYVAEISSPAQIHMRIKNASIVDIATVFSNRSETRIIKHGGSEYKGFTNIVAIVPEGGFVRVVLSRKE